MSQQARQTSTTAQTRTYRFGNSTLTICFGDLTTSQAQALVNSQDTYICMSAGVGAGLLKAGGEGIAIDASKKVPASVGDVVVTSAGVLPAQYIFHAITLGHSDLSVGDIVKQVTHRCMQLVDYLGLSSIAFPAIGTGMAGFPYGEVAARMADVIAGSLAQSRRSIDATLYLYGPAGDMTAIDFIRFFEEFAMRVPQVASHLSERSPTPALPEADAATAAAQTEEEWRRIRVHNIRRFLGSLEDHRSKLEQQLIGLLETTDVAHDHRIRTALSENMDLRLQYLGELRSLSAQAGQYEGAMGSRKLRPWGRSDSVRNERPSVPNIDIFFSYSHCDEALRNELATHLALLERAGAIRSWCNRMIGAGQDWKSEIDSRIDHAQVVLLLVSSDYLASDYCYDVEMIRSLARHDAGEAVVLPIILRPCNWSRAPFAHLQGLPKDAKPVTKWLDRDDAWTNVSLGIEAALAVIYP